MTRPGKDKFNGAPLEQQITLLHVRIHRVCPTRSGKGSIALAAPPENGGMLGAMDSTLAAFQAKQALAKMNRLKGDVQQFATDAKMLKSMADNLDSRPLLDEAMRLLQKLGAARLEFLGPQGNIETMARAFPSRPPSGGGMSPAAQWIPELRAASKQFAEAVHSAETAVRQLGDTAVQGLNSPTRTSTGAPENLLDIVMNFIDMLNRWVEHYNKTHHK